MSQKFTTICEAILRNSSGCELDRVEIPVVNGDLLMPREVLQWWASLSPGDTIRIEERETEVN